MVKNKILIADDEADIALILRLQLEDAGFTTVRARDGAEALEMLEREECELVLLDIRMPRVDGMQVLERVTIEHPELAVVMMTAHGSEEIAVEAMKRGALDYITKPFSTDDMLKRVERAIRYNRTRHENLILQQELAAEKKKIEAILEGMADLLVAVDTEGRLMTVNRKAELVLGGDREELLGRDVSELLRADIPPERLPCRVVLASGAPCLDVAYTLRRAAGDLPVLSSATPLYGSAGELVGCVEIIRDISVLKALEQEREDFVSMLSHDLKTPITAIVGSLDLVREERLGPINQDQREFIESAEESCDEMVQMINTLLDIHKFEAGMMVLHTKREEPVPVLEKTMAKFAPVAKRADVELSASLPKNLPQVVIDRNLVTRLLGNILSNAVKFTPAGGRIEVTAELVADGKRISEWLPAQLYPEGPLRAEGRFLLIAVHDTGAGIPADALGTIFDRFVQAKNRRQGKTKGTGLGLAFCRKVMDVHHGYIWAESEEGKGSTFRLLFPVDDRKKAEGGES